MRIDSLFYRLAYRSGRPRWDNTEPRPELTELTRARPPGRALDLGCGTGTDAIYLAGQGWEAVGVDFVPEAIATARSRAAASGSSASFAVGDITRLREAGIRGDFDLVIDIGCYHAIPTRLRDSYATEVAAVTRPGADLYLAGISDPPATWRLIGARGVSADDLRRRFGADFSLADEQAAGPVGRAGSLVLYHLIRKDPQPNLVTSVLTRQGVQALSKPGGSGLSPAPYAVMQPAADETRTTASPSRASTEMQKRAAGERAGSGQPGVSCRAPCAAVSAPPAAPSAPIPPAWQPAGPWRHAAPCQSAWPGRGRAPVVMPGLLGEVLAGHAPQACEPCGAP